MTLRWPCFTINLMIVPGRLTKRGLDSCACRLLPHPALATVTRLLFCADVAWNGSCESCCAWTANQLSYTTTIGRRCGPCMQGPTTWEASIFQRCCMLCKRPMDLVAM